MEFNEVSPPGWTGTVRAMKTHKGPKKNIDNPYALSWWMKKKGEKSHYKDQPTSKKGTAKKKKGEKNECNCQSGKAKCSCKKKCKCNKLMTFKEWLKKKIDV